jgi:glycosyltransferase involved in cell wall biosynthesis
MKLLHVTPHLGGGVGKAHAALCGALPKEAVGQTFVLLEEPRDRRYLQMIEAGGARVIVADGLDHVARLAATADIVQFEFWNHPRLFECLAHCVFPALRSVFWSHISGLSKPLIQPGLMEEAGRFVFTTEASRSIPSLALMAEAARKKIAVINSGFGFPDDLKLLPSKGRKPVIAYLGTVDFVKMHPGFFDAIDGLVGGDIQVSVWGAVDPSGPVAARAHAMRHPGRIKFCGVTADPAVALLEADIFFYPLQPDHYGTAENALIEAMSLGLTPVVLDNPAETAIVSDSRTGFIAHSIEECISLLQMLLLLPDLREKISRNAIRHIAETRTPARSALDFMILWLGLLSEPTRQCNFQVAIGESPADWFLATQYLPGAAREAPSWETAQHPSKGTLAHFESVFAGDVSLAQLRRQA